MKAIALARRGMKLMTPSRRSRLVGRTYERRLGKMIGARGHQIGPHAAYGEIKGAYPAMRGAGGPLAEYVTGGVNRGIRRLARLARK